MIHAFQYRRGGGGSIRDVPRVRFVWSGAVCAHPALHANYPVTTYYTLYFSMKVDTEYVHRRRSTLA